MSRRDGKTIGVAMLVTATLLAMPNAKSSSLLTSDGENCDIVNHIAHFLKALGQSYHIKQQEKCLITISVEGESDLRTYKCEHMPK